MGSSRENLNEGGPKIWKISIKVTSRGLEALQSTMNDSYHKSVLYWPEPTINHGWTKGIIPISDHRLTIAQSQYVKGVLDTIGISHSDP